jgi:hypothetical protein
MNLKFNFTVFGESGSVLSEFYESSVQALSTPILKSVQYFIQYVYECTIHLL